MRTTTIGSVRVPVIGQGTWKMGTRPQARADEVRALQLGVDLGMTLIDTAEMYASGGAEEVVGEAIAGRHDQVYIVTKVLPQNATYKGTIAAAEASLRRLKIDTIDLYLLHWPGNHPLERTLAAFTELQAAGKIRDYGVSNFDVDAMEALLTEPGGMAVRSNQVYYNLQVRGPDYRLIPWQQERGINFMAYSPVEKGTLRESTALQRVAERHGVTPYGIAVAWSARLPGVVSIPKAVQEAHVRENARAGAIEFTPDDLAELDAEFPPPRGDGPLETA